MYANKTKSNETKAPWFGQRLHHTSFSWEINEDYSATPGAGMVCVCVGFNVTLDT